MAFGTCVYTCTDESLEIQNRYDHSLLKKSQNKCHSYYKKMWQPQNFLLLPDGKVMQLLIWNEEILGGCKLHSEDSRRGRL